MRKLINDPNAIKTIYNYLMDIPDLQYFHLTKLPRTEYHKDILEKNEPTELSFIKDLATKFQNEVREFKSFEMIERFNNYIKLMGKKEYSIDAPTLLLRLKNFNIKGISKKPTSVCNITVIDFELVRAHFKIKLEDSFKDVEVD
jgi:hypothetical protein